VGSGRLLEDDAFPWRSHRGRLQSGGPGGTWQMVA